MNKLSVGAQIAWQIAAREATLLKHQHIEKEHILIGICSIEKVLRLGATEAELSPQGWQSLETEYHELEVMLHGFKIDSTLLRRQVRERLGQGNYERNENERVVHRSNACRNVFNHADVIASSSGKTSCLHLLAAMLEKPGNIIGPVLKQVSVNSADLRERLLACAAKKDKDIAKNLKKNSEVIIDQYVDASKKLSSKERENLYNRIKTLIEKLDKATDDEELVNILKEIIFDIRKAHKKTELLKPCEESLEDIEKHIREADFKSYKNELITGLKKKFDEIKCERM